MYLSSSFKLDLLVCLVAVFSGCNAKGPKFSGFETPKDDESLLYVYRPSAAVGSMVKYSIGVTSDDDNKTLIRLRNGGFLKTSLKANKEYEIWAKTEAKSSVVIETKPNEIYCVKGGVGIGFFVGRPQLQAVDLETCQKEIKKTRSSLEKEIKN